MAKTLIAFYSRADQNYVGGEIIDLETGNTETAAYMIKSITNADIFKLEQLKPYDKNYNKCIEQAQDDQRRDARPELTAYPEDMEQYDTIYLGYPNYWSTMPMAVFTFLEKYDFSKKVIRPFCTHEGSGFGNSLNDIKRLCPRSDIQKGIAIKGGSVLRSQKEIEKWIKGFE